MKKLLFLLATLFTLNLQAQNDFSTQMRVIADTLSKKIIQNGNKKVAVVEFINLDNSVTQLGQFLCDELSSELSNLTENLTRFSVIERSNIELVFKEKNLIKSVDGGKTALDLGSLNMADILVWAIVSDFEGYYRVNIKLLDTKTGNALSSFKTQFIKTPSLESFNKIVIAKDNPKQAETVEIPAYTKQPVAVTQKSDPCEQSQTGTLKITSNWENRRLYQSSKVVIRIPKSQNPTSNDDYYYITLDKGETKEFELLKEGMYDYEAKQYCDGIEAYKGWCSYSGTVSSGVIKITRCEVKQLVIK